MATAAYAQRPGTPGRRAFEEEEIAESLNQISVRDERSPAGIKRPGDRTTSNPFGRNLKERSKPTSRDGS